MKNRLFSFYFGKHFKMKIIFGDDLVTRTGSFSGLQSPRRLEHPFHGRLAFSRTATFDLCTTQFARRAGTFSGDAFGWSTVWVGFFPIFQSSFGTAARHLFGKFAHVDPFFLEPARERGRFPFLPRVLSTASFVLFDEPAAGVGARPHLELPFRFGFYSIVEGFVCRRISFHFIL
jgi:hypothetical protein